MSVFIQESKKILYRGFALSQHNRYTKEVIIAILRVLKETLLNKISHLRIRTTDLSTDLLTIYEESL
ncbi:hypothetical protein [Helicobacter suis]|uniref:hypothetical protein n=1 Tax=Helicobacter suis TaxID=104628 RepID=UPI001E4DE63F|nr:hypothetical protein [Helicobacter suis]